MRYSRNQKPKRRKLASQTWRKSKTEAPLDRARRQLAASSQIEANQWPGRDHSTAVFAPRQDHRNLCICNGTWCSRSGPKNHEHIPGGSTTAGAYQPKACVLPIFQSLANFAANRPRHQKRSRMTPIPVYPGLRGRFGSGGLAAHCAGSCCNCPEQMKMEDRPRSNSVFARSPKSSPGCPQTDEERLTLNRLLMFVLLSQLLP